ncbi:heme o synthase [Membranicola marinus]|uniref:Protoheme IX farnesyltransferase n=1 Tax=Membranihabitans marinus TaxID=1227546 RepID=A0A953HV44_9BACT|nr:heme o synthase [Membranihabitans marinus]MBY5959015.1 heme o synthase [Membranihabitans marinus]
MNSIQHSVHIIRDSVYDLGLLVKFKLSLLVVFTSSLAYIMVGGWQFGLHSLVIFALGGFMISGAANAMNQILEKDYDSQMERTRNRPVASGRMATPIAVLLAGLLCVGGLLLLAYFNPLTALLGAVSLISYAFVYTPLKRYSPIAVFVGAFPGALPVLVGCVAVDGTITTFAILLFALQFFWQFPHFWAIGWLSFKDYKKAGFHIVPVNEDGSIDSEIGLQSLIYTVLMIPVVGLFFYFNMIGVFGLVFLMGGTFYFIYKAYQFYTGPSDLSARKLMFASLYFLPIMFCVLLFNQYL